MPQRLGKVTLAEVLRRAVEARLAEVRVSMPGTIQKFDPATQLAEVRPDLKELRFDEDDTEVVEALGVLSDVPCHFPGGGGFSITWPVQAGDPCLLIFSDRALDKWIDNGGQVDPGDLRRHHLSDAVAILGVRAKPGALEAFDGAHITLGKDGSPADFVALAAKVDQALADLAQAFSEWVPAPNDGGAALKAKLSTLAGTGWPASVASTTVKVKG